MNYQDACDLLSDYSAKLENKTIQPSDLPPEYFIAVSTVIKETNDEQSEHFSPAPETWTDFSALIEDMAEHAKNNGRAIICADQPAFLCIGWACTNTEKTWFIKISDLKNQLDAATSGNVLPLDKKAFLRTPEGKAAFCNAINNKNK